MSARLFLTLGLTIAAVAFGAWRLVLPATETASSDVSDGVSSLISTRTRGSLTAAQMNLDAQRNATGSYAGAVVQPPLTLMQADESSYCLQLAQGPVLQHLAGPAGALVPGAC